VYIKLKFKPKEFLQEILELRLSRVLPDITIAVRVFVSLPEASKASGERTFSVLTQVKNYCRSTMGQDCLTGFATLNINLPLHER
jgi:hypothetical protein